MPLVLTYMFLCSPGHAGKEGLHLAMTEGSCGFSRAAAPVWGFTRGWAAPKSPGSREGGGESPGNRHSWNSSCLQASILKKPSEVDSSLLRELREWACENQTQRKVFLSLEESAGKISGTQEVPTLVTRPPGPCTPSLVLRGHQSL